MQEKKWKDDNSGWDKEKIKLEKRVSNFQVTNFPKIVTF